MRHGSKCGRGCDDAPVVATNAPRRESKANATWQALSLGVQPKLTVSTPHDAAEQEADRVADRVVSGGTADTQMSGTGAPSVARACATCEEEEKEEVVQAKQSSGGAAAGGAQTAVAATQDSGAPLSGDTRGYFEPRFGRDLSAVRIHTGGEAAAAATGINALAYTYGNHIVFGAGEYSPDTFAGRKLLAHELTHVVQQGGEHAHGEPVIARASAGELWDAVWGVGPIDAWRAASIATEAKKATRATGLPGIENGPADAWRHCFWNCNLTRALGFDQAETIATNHEEHGGGTINATAMDLANNIVGRYCGGDNCDSCCQNALDSGRLWVLNADGVAVPSTRTPRNSGAQGGTGYKESDYSRLPPDQRPPPAPSRREPIERCFTGGMPVTLFDGTSIPIEQIVVGDRVLAYDETRRESRVCQVLECHRHSAADYREVFLQDGRRLEVTANHELFVGDGWMEAGRLRPGSVLYSNDRDRGITGIVSTAVERVAHAAMAAPLFDITVAECHNYFVNGILAHNKNV